MRRGEYEDNFDEQKGSMEREDTWGVRGSSLRAGGGGEADDDVVTSRVREITRDNILDLGGRSVCWAQCD